ncbi:IS1096 element passenger TnpR family protein [Massilia brevitalea]|uniref:IS1096 element passenger TnpR family protein n=1 Tax=Massilia brevitalea TaxID=442526 RepID=UPI002738C2F9|nr:hypothetical protein [Massilia brevitalea]
MNTILTLSITCISGAHLVEDYRFVLALQAESTLEELGACILEVLDFDGDHLSEFYVANTPHGKRAWSTKLVEPEGDTDDWQTRLCGLYPLGHNKKLYYRYDLGAEWQFEIVRKGRETSALEGQAYPVLVMEEGIKPLEYGDDDGF